MFLSIQPTSDESLKERLFRLFISRVSPHLLTTYTPPKQLGSVFQEMHTDSHKVKTQHP
ncbi:unnamed protein product [Bubo scandiacus]